LDIIVSKYYLIIFLIPRPI